MIELTCPVCNTIYKTYQAWINAGRAKYCSQACAYQRRPKPGVTMVTFNCQECGKEVSRRKGGENKAMYCSNPCKTKGWWRLNGAEYTANLPQGADHWNYKGGPKRR